uniref:Hydroxysteroid (17-beta) dehydrogenase 3 n=1 Tax=Mastacembelus armatus TaxID=205130 RepID=A0A7N8XM72_9TELE
MDLIELFSISLGAAVAVYCGMKLLLFTRILFPNLWFPLSETFFTSMGEWAVVTGGSEGIGRAYAFALAKQGLNVVIMSRTKAKLDQVAKEIGDATGQRVKVIIADFTKENIFSEIEDQLKDLNIGVLVNNVGILPSIIPCKFLEAAQLDQVSGTLQLILKFQRRKGLIVNISSGIAAIPFPLYNLYSASKVFVERFSQGLQAEYKDKGIIIQAVTPFGVSTRMTAYQKTNIVTLTPEDFVNRALQYVRAGDKTNGSISHAVLGWFLQSIPFKIFYSDFMLQSLQDYVKARLHMRN